MRVTRWIVVALVGGVALLTLAAFVARFHDGPLGALPGGPLRAGLLQDSPILDWSFAADEERIEMQLLSQNLSRTTWLLVRDGAAFIPCSLSFPPGKSWHRIAVRDGRALLRIRGRRYTVVLERVEDADLAQKLGYVLRAKYGHEPLGSGGIWYFRVTWQRLD
jgi:hypothetical protein